MKSDFQLRTNASDLMRSLQGRGIPISTSYRIKVSVFRRFGKRRLQLRRMIALSTDSHYTKMRSGIFLGNERHRLRACTQILQEQPDLRRLLSLLLRSHTYNVLPPGTSSLRKYLRYKKGVRVSMTL